MASLHLEVTETLISDLRMIGLDGKRGSNNFVLLLG